MHILDKFNIVPVPFDQLPIDNLAPVQKRESVLPIILFVSGIVICSAIAYHYFRKNRVKEEE